MSARVREGGAAGIHTCTHIPTQTQVIPLEEEDVELT